MRAARVASKERVKAAQDLILDAKNEEQAQEFKAKFFPDGLPEFTAKIIDDYHYGVFVRDKLVYRQFIYPVKKANAEGVAKLEKELRDLLIG